MNSDLDSATAAMKKIANPQGSQTHPPRDERVSAITEGWNKAREQIGDTDPPTPPSPQPPPPPAVARACVVGSGPNDFCRMMVQIPVGSECNCYTPNGVYPGIAR